MSETGDMTATVESPSWRSQIAQAGLLRTAIFGWYIVVALGLTMYMVWTGVSRYRLLYDGADAVAEVTHREASVMRYRFTTRTGAVIDASDDARSYFMPVGTQMPVKYLASNPSISLPLNQLNNRWEQARVLIALLMLLAFPMGLKWLWREQLLKRKWWWSRRTRCDSGGGK